MYSFYSKKPYFIFYIFLVLQILSCRESADESVNSNQGQQMEQLQSKVIVFGEVKNHEDQALVGVSVSIGNQIVQTDEMGYFQLEGIEGVQILRINKAGYLSQRHRFSAQKGIQKSLGKLKLWPQAEAQLLDSDMGGELEGMNGARVQAPPLAFVNQAGDLVSGMVEVHITPLDASNPLSLTALSNQLIATQSSGETVLLQSYGMLEVTVMQGEEELNVAAGKQLKIQIPAPAMTDGDLPVQTGLWSFDEENNIWIEEGMASLNIQSNTYEADIPHLSAWNADDPTQAACVCGHVIDDETGQVLAGAQITAIGQSYDGVTDDNTDSNGDFCINVRVSSSVEITAQHDLGGGMTKTVNSTASIASVPVNRERDQCLDAGEFRVKKRVIIIEDTAGNQTSTACSNDNPLSALGECFNNFAGFHDCYVPSGACTYLVGKDDQTSIQYENGAKTVVRSDGSYEYYGAQNQLCYTTTLLQNDNDQSIQYRYESTNGTSIIMTYSYTGDMSWECSDGSKVTISAQQNQEFQVCSPAVPSPQMGPEGNCAILYSQCESNQDCEESSPLCCVAQSETITYKSCVADQMSCDLFKAQITSSSK